MGISTHFSSPSSNPLSSREVGLLGLAASLALMAMFVGRNAQVMAFLFCISLSMAIAIPLLLSSSKRQRRPNLFIFTAGGALVLQVLTSTYLPATAFDSQPYLLPLGLALTWATLAIVGNEMLARRKASGIDRTSSIDAILVALGTGAVIWVFLVAPAIHDTEWTTVARNFYLLTVLAEVCLFGAIMRIAIAPVKRAPEINLFVTGGLLVFFGNVMSTAQMIAPVDKIQTIAIALLSLGALLMGAASAKSSAAFWDTPGEPSSLGVSYARLVGTSLAVVTPLLLAVLSRENAIASVGVGVIGVCTAVLITIRFAGLMQAHVTELEHESVISRNAIAMTAMVNREAMYKIALESVMTLCANKKAKGAIFALNGNDWRFIAQDPQEKALRDIGIELIRDDLAVLRAESQRESFDPLPRLLGPVGRELWVFPIAARGSLLGVVVISNLGSVRRMQRAIIRVLCDLAVAEQTANAAEGLHKRRSEQRFHSLVSHSQDLVGIVQEDGVFSYLSPACASILGYVESELVGRRIAEFFDVGNAENLRRSFLMLASRSTSVAVSEVDYRHPTDGTRQLSVTITDLREDETVHGFVINIRDCTEQKSLESDLRQKALFDDLTGIANRALLREHTARALARSSRSQEVSAVLMLDLDDFKTVNDALGYPNGDEIIRVMAFRLSQYVREDDVVARLGGDEFAILVSDVQSEGEVMNVASRILEVVERSIDFGEREVSLTASIGIAIFNEGGTADSILRDADVAMYRAKERGKGSVIVFDESMHQSAVERLDLKSDLSKALHNDQLSLFYQPIVKLNGELLGFEALMRWHHPVRGPISPGTFIPLAEESGLIVSMGEWALREATSQLGRWRSEFKLPNLTVSVNVSPRQLMSPNLLSVIKESVLDNGLNAESLIVELTESELVDDRVASDQLLMLRRLGVGIAADDFGSGFASYAALAQLPFTIVKMDRSLIQNLSNPYSNSHAQVRSIIEMAHGIGIEVTAEGIEEEEQRVALLNMACDKAQGFLFSKPLPADDIVGIFVSQGFQRRVPVAPRPATTSSGNHAGSPAGSPNESFS